MCNTFFFKNTKARLLAAEVGFSGFYWRFRNAVAKIGALAINRITIIRFTIL